MTPLARAHDSTRKFGDTLSKFGMVNFVLKFSLMKKCVNIAKLVTEINFLLLDYGIVKIVAICNLHDCHHGQGFLPQNATHSVMHCFLRCDIPLFLTPFMSHLTSASAHLALKSYQKWSTPE